VVLDHHKWLRVFWQSLFVPLSEQTLVSTISVATVGDADMELGRCVVGMKMQVEFEDGYGTSVASRLV